MTQVTKQRPRTPRQAARQVGPLDRLLKTEVFKALSDPTRTKLLACLAKCGRMCSVSEVAQCSAVDFSVVSRHLTVLANAGVLHAQKRGRTVWYQVRFEDLSTWFGALADALQTCCVDGSCCGGEC